VLVLAAGAAAITVCRLNQERTAMGFGPAKRTAVRGSHPPIAMCPKRQHISCSEHPYCLTVLQACATVKFGGGIAAFLREAYDSRTGTSLPHWSAKQAAGTDGLGRAGRSTGPADVLTVLLGADLPKIRPLRTDRAEHGAVPEGLPRQPSTAGAEVAGRWRLAAGSCLCRWISGAAEPARC